MTTYVSPESLRDKTQGLDPNDPSLTEEQKNNIMKRCIFDFQYFMDSIIHRRTQAKASIVNRK